MGRMNKGYLDPASNPLITDVVTTPQGAWYRFKIPIDNYTRAVGGISDFRSIRFMRMFLTNGVPGPHFVLPPWISSAINGAQ